MSRTYRKIRNKAWAKEFNDGKIQTGPGGISCSCCIPFHRDDVKPEIRRWERHTANAETRILKDEDFPETPIDKTE